MYGDVYEIRGNLYIIRGLPGSGKTTLGNQLRKANKSGTIHIATDDYFTDPSGRYFFDPSKIAVAHEECLRRATEAMMGGISVIVANTFSQRWEFQKYLDGANLNDFSYTVLDLFDNGCDDYTLQRRQKHGVPIETIAAMRARWEHDWSNAPKTREVT